MENSLNPTLNYLRAEKATSKLFAVIDPTGTGGDYRTINEAIEDSAKMLYLKKGTHTLTNSACVSQVSIIGESRDDTIIDVGEFQLYQEASYTNTDTGTISVPALSKTVTGAGTTFSAAAGSRISVEINKTAHMRVASIGGDTLMTLQAIMAGPGYSGATFNLIQTSATGNCGALIANLTITGNDSNALPLIKTGGFQGIIHNVNFSGKNIGSTFLLDVGGAGKISQELIISECHFEGANIAIRLTQARNCTIRNCGFANVATGIMIKDQSNNVTIETCSLSAFTTGISILSSNIRDITISNTVFADGTTGISSSSSATIENLAISNCIFRSNTTGINTYADYAKINASSFIDCEVAVELYADHATVSSCTIFNPSSVGIYVRGTYATITGCTFNMNYFTSGVPATGIDLAATCDYATITGNAFYDSGDYVIYGHGQKHSTITANIFNGRIGQYAIYAESPQYLAISANSFQNFAACAAYVTSGLGVSISGNSFQACATCAELDAVTHYTITANTFHQATSLTIRILNSSHNGTITGNDINQGASHGISIDGSEHVTITGNRVYDAGGNGIVTSATCNFILITGNSIAECTLSGIDSAAPSSTINGNISKSNTLYGITSTGSSAVITGNICQTNGSGAINDAGLLSVSDNNITT